MSSKDFPHVTAEQLYSMAMSTDSSRVRGQLEEIIQKLLAAANNSTFTITVGGTLFPGTIKELQARHFKVECGDDRNETYTIISFQHAVPNDTPKLSPQLDLVVPPSCFDR